MRRSSGWAREWVWMRMRLGVRGSQGRGGRRGGRSQHDWGRRKKTEHALLEKAGSRRSDYWRVEIVPGLVGSLEGGWNAAIQISTAQSARWHHVGARVNEALTLRTWIGAGARPHPREEREEKRDQSMEVESWEGLTLAGTEMGITSKVGVL
jgi:hypothetical protein